MGKHLVLVGGGHAHLTALRELRAFTGGGHGATVVSPEPYQYYSGMGPGMLGGAYRPRETRFNIERMTRERGGEFLKDRVVGVDPVGRRLSLASGKTLDYDVASFSIGSSVPTESLDVSGPVYTVKPIVNLLRARREVLAESCPLDAVVAGGGPAGAEVAANLAELIRRAARLGSVTLVTGGELMEGYPGRVRSLIWKGLSRRGVRISQGKRVVAVEEGGVRLSDGSRLGAGLVLLALGVRPPGLFRDSGLPVGDDGGLLVNHYLQCAAHPEIFGGGDCISLEGEGLAKVGVYAVRENPVLFHNLRAALEGRPLMSFDPGGGYLLAFNLGGERGVLWKGPVIFNGRLAFRIKGFIDRRFMRRFQVSGETEEED
jgi:NADH dehydrogenase FAD-containing subunit